MLNLIQHPPWTLNRDQGDDIQANSVSYLACNFPDSLLKEQRKNLRTGGTLSCLGLGDWMGVCIGDSLPGLV